VSRLQRATGPAIVILLLATLASAAPPKPIVSCETGAATLSLMYGISHQMYWLSGQDGKVAEKIAQGHFRARDFMQKHEGDWCLFRLTTSDTSWFCLGSDIRIALEFTDTTLISTDILSVEGPKEDHVYSAASGMTFKRGTWPLASPKLGGWPLYVRLPEGSCLTDQSEGDSGRRFKSPPLSVQVLKGGE
jgi:hypothetical protein